MVNRRGFCELFGIVLLNLLIFVSDQTGLCSELKVAELEEENAKLQADLQDVQLRLESIQESKAAMDEALEHKDSTLSELQRNYNDM
jgi:chromosome segregation ATPase